MNKLPRIKTRSTANAEKTGIILDKNSDVNRTSFLRPGTFTSKPESEENVGSELSTKVFCCAPYWLAYIYGEQPKCLCKYAPVGATTVSQPALEPESGKGDVTSVKNLRYINTANKETTSLLHMKAQAQLRLPLKKRSRLNDSFDEKIQNKQKTQLFIMNKEKLESNLNSVLKTSSKTLNKTRQNIADDQAEAQRFNDQLCNGKEAEAIPIVSDIVSISLHKCDPDMNLEAMVMIPEKVQQYISEEKTLISPMSNLQNGKGHSEAHLTKADQNKNILNVDQFKLNPIKSGGQMSTEDTGNLVHMEQGHRTFTSFESDSKKNSGETERVYSNNISIYPACEVPEEHSLTSSIIGEIPEQSTVSSDINIEQHSQNLPLGDQEHHVSWTNQLSEILAEFPSGMHSTGQSEVNETAAVKQKDCGKEDIDQSHVQHNDTIVESIQNQTYSKQFCCFLSWSASACGEQSKCSCTNVSRSLNSGGQEQKICSKISHQSYEDKSTLVQDVDTSASKGVHSTNWSDDGETALINQKDCDMEVIDRGLDNGEDLVKQFDEYRSLLNSESDSVQRAISDDATAEKVENSKQYCCLLSWSASVSGEQSKCLCTSVSRTLNSGGEEQNICSQIHKNTRADETNKKETVQPSNRLHLRKKKVGPPRYEMVDSIQGLGQSNSSLPYVSYTNSEKRTTSVKKRGSLFPKKVITQTKEVEKKILFVQSRIPESSKEGKVAFGPANVDLNKSYVSKKSVRARKDTSKHSKVQLKRKDQSPKIQLCKKLFVKKDTKAKYVSPKKKITSKRGSGLKKSKTKSTRLLKNVGGSLSKRDLKDPSQMSKEVRLRHPKNQCVLPNATDRQKRRKMTSNIPAQTSQGTPKDNCAPELNSQPETKAPSQLRKIDAHKKLSKNNKTVVKQNGKDFNVPPEVQKVAEETHQEIVPEDKPHSAAKSKKRITEGKKTRSMSGRRLCKPGLDRQNISSVETAEASPPSNERNKDNLKSPMTKSENDVALNMEDPHTVPKTPPSRRSNQDLNTKIAFPIVYLDCQLKISKCNCCVIKANNDVKVPAVQETKANDTGEKCTNIGHKGKKRYTGPRQRQAKNPGPGRGSSKRTTSLLSHQNGLVAEEKPIITKQSSPDPDQTSGSPLGHVGHATLSSKTDGSVDNEVNETSKSSQDIDQPPNKKIKTRSYLENVQAVSTSLTILTKSANKVGVGTKSTDNSPQRLEREATPASNVSCGRPLDLPTGTEKTLVRQCVLKLCRLPHSIERQFLLDNMRFTGKKRQSDGEG